MGIFTSQADSKDELIRLLLKHRIAYDAQAHAQGFRPAMVDGMNTLQINSAPEATIVSIVEHFYALSAKGLDQETALQTIDVHRASTGNGASPVLGSLEEFVAYRVVLEHKVLLPDAHLFICTEAATIFYTDYQSNRGRAQHAVDYGCLRLERERHNEVMRTLAQFAEAECDENDLWNRLEPIMAEWEVTERERQENLAKGQFLRELHGIDRPY